MHAFAAATWGCPLKVIDGCWLTMPDGVLLLGRKNLGHTLYVREAYIALYEELESLKARDFAHVVVSGNPGTGKSWFALYVLVR